jgi:outer membrane protein TolC
LPERAGLKTKNMIQNKIILLFNLITGLWRQNPARTIPGCLPPGNKAFIAFSAILLFALFPFTRDLHGQTLDHYLQEAAENNPELRARFHEYQSSLERVPQVGSLPDPQLSFGYYIRPMEFPMGDQRADLSLMQMFPWFGTLSSREDEASRMAWARYESFRDTKNRLYFNIKTVWYELYELEREIAIMEKNLELLRDLEELSLIRFQSAGFPQSPASGPSSSTMPSGNPAGSSSTMSSISAGTMTGGSMGAGTGNMSAGGASPRMQSMPAGAMQGGSMGGGGMSDVLRARMEINEMENMIALLIDTRDPLLARFNRLLNRPALVEVVVPDTLEISIQAGTRQALLENIIEENPMIKMLEEEAGAYQSRQRTAMLEGRPSFGAGLNYMVFSSPSNDAVSMGGRNMVMPMVTISLPIYRGKYRAREREAMLLRESAISRQENMVNELSVQLSDVLKDIADAERRTGLYRRQAELAGQAMDILITDYSVGRVRFEEVLRLQEQLFGYQLGLLRAVADHNRVIARLEMLTASEITSDTSKSVINR